uniref:Uncharacterized protein n=1 Tax=Anguilla anguilla TaxID=7936 RepID=A0A0E9QD73_ANGAN
MCRYCLNLLSNKM